MLQEQTMHTLFYYENEHLKRGYLHICINTYVNDSNLRLGGSPGVIKSAATNTAIASVTFNKVFTMKIINPILIL